MRVVIDTDAGVDDATAIMMALHSLPRDAVHAITTVFGNVDLHQANHNVAHILDAMNRSDIPIHSGASKPIVAKVSEDRWEGHGPDGLGGQAGHAIETAASKNDAVHTLVDLAHKYSGELVVVALGPLTNIALAMLIDPSFFDHVKLFVVMGGLSRGEGNFTPHTEFNVGCDPEATNIVLEHCTDASKLVLLPFETSIDHGFSWDTFDEIFHDGDNPRSDYLRRIWRHNKSFMPHDGFLPCDAYAMAILLCPKYVKTTSVRVGRVHLAPDEHRGLNLWDDQVPIKGLKPNTTVVTQVDKELFLDLLRALAASK